MISDYRVFISHAVEDKDRFVLDFARRLRDSGVDAWVDEWELLPGDPLVDKIFEGIKYARAMVIILSKYSVNKPWVREELYAGFLKRLEGKCRIIPVVIDDCEIPEALRSTVWLRVPDLGHYEDAFQGILNSIYGVNCKPPLGAPAAQVRRQKVKDDLEAGRLRVLDTVDAQQELEGLILDKYEPPLLRLQALNFYLSLKSWSGKVLERLLADPDSQIRRTVLKGIHENPQNDILKLFDTSKVKLILADPDDEAAVASTVIACDLVENKIIPVDVLTSLHKHSYWLVRRIAIQGIIKSRDPKTLDLLYEFRATGYHVSQQLIRDYIENHYKTFDENQKKFAIDLLRNLLTTQRASQTSKSKTEKLISLLLQE